MKITTFSHEIPIKSGKKICLNPFSSRFPALKLHYSSTLPGISHGFSQIFFFNFPFFKGPVSQGRLRRAAKEIVIRAVPASMAQAPIRA
jgi:hypothetical protein